MIGGVDQGGVGVAVAVEVDPGELAEAADVWEGSGGGEGAVAVVAQERGRAGEGAEEDVEVAVGFDVDGPSAGVGGVEDRRGELGLGGDVGEVGGVFLAEEADACGTCEDEVGLEVEVEIDGEDALGGESGGGVAAGEREGCAGGEFEGGGVRVGEDGGVCAVEAEG